MYTFINDILNEVDRQTGQIYFGRVANVVGLLVEVEGLQGAVSVSDHCDITTKNGHKLPCEVVGFRDGKALVMHVRECSPGEIKVPFHVGDDHSRTWVITRTDTGLRLKHDHRHADGSPDAVTMYGGDTDGDGTAVRQSFPVDAEWVAMFGREGLKASIQTAWAMEIEPGQRFLYELSRPGGRLFQVEFDLSQPVEPPPAPWGHE